MRHVFDVLRQILRRREITYKQLGAAVDMSEGTIKNLFSRGECQMSRLAKICSALGVSMAEVIAAAESSGDGDLILSEEQEQCFADNPRLFEFFRACFYDEMTPRQFKRRRRLDERALESYMRALESLGLAERHPDQRLRFLVRGKLRWRPRGPWMRKYYVSINALAAERVLSNDSTYYSVGYFSISAEQAAIIRAELDALVKKHRDQAARDYLVRDRLELRSVSWTFALVPGDIGVEVAVPRP